VYLFETHAATEIEVVEHVFVDSYGFVFPELTVDEVVDVE
jgi:hypothetical protein